MHLKAPHARAWHTCRASRRCASGSWGSNPERLRRRAGSQPHVEPPTVGEPAKLFSSGPSRLQQRGQGQSCFPASWGPGRVSGGNHFESFFTVGTNKGQWGRRLTREAPSPHEPAKAIGGSSEQTTVFRRTCRASGPCAGSNPESPIVGGTRKGERGRSLTWSHHQ